MRHSSIRPRPGHTDAWEGDLNPDLPTKILPAAELPERVIVRSEQPPLHVLRAVLDGLKQL
jgi:hypothetical protein